MYSLNDLSEQQFNQLAADLPKLYPSLNQLLAAQPVNTVARSMNAVLVAFMASTMANVLEEPTGNAPSLNHFLMQLLNSISVAMLMRPDIADVKSALIVLREAEKAAPAPGRAATLQPA